jgi:hypothetical protein
MRSKKKKLSVGPVCGHHFDAVGSLIVCRKIAQISARGKILKEGVLISKKWLFDQKLFETDPAKAWAKEHWIEWK